jgi:hypothetical protein
VRKRATFGGLTGRTLLTVGPAVLQTNAVTTFSYAAAGVFPVTVTIEDAAGRRIIAQSSAHVSR